MSLIVWLPLNGDSHNQGLKKYTETTNTLSYAINGKVTEKCADKGKLVYNKNPLQMVGTICFWLYPKSAAEGNDGKSSIIFGNNTFNDSARKWSLYMFPDNKSLHSWGCQKEGSTTFNGSFTYNNVLKESTWNHVCVAHDLKNEYIYVNSNLIGTVPWDSSGTYNFDKETDIIRDETWETGTNNFKINDFRIYDHCLTQSEVSEIAKGLMLHYSFENPYAEGTINIPHSLIVHDNNSGEATLGSDSTGNYIIKNGMTTWSGIGIEGTLVKPGRYYIWSMEVMSIKDIEYVIDGNGACKNSSHGGNDIHFDIIRGYSHQNHKLDGSDTLPKGKLEAYKWTRIYFTVKVKQDCTNPYISHTFVPYIPSGDSSVKVYYRNSQLEEKPYDTPYTPSNREAGLIRDNSGMGNDGTQVYQREEIPITINPTADSYLSINHNSGLFTVTGFNGNDNQCVTLGTIKYNSRYHYLNSLVSYEFDITFKDLVMADGKTLSDYNTSAFTDTPTQVQGQIYYTDGTHSWTKNEPVRCQIAKRLNDGKTSNGTFHICYENTITDSSIVTNINYYEFGIRFNYIKSGTITISNLHAYYRNLDTSKLTIADKSAVGTHSAYFNGKNYIDCGLVTPLEIDELTLSCWAYRDDWSTLSLGGLYDSALISSVNTGGFGFKLERCAQESIDKSINFVIYYKDAGYLEHAKSYGMGIDYTKLSSGWHLITGVATRNKAVLYIDGEKVRECIHNLNKPIYNYDTTNKKRNNLLVGAECETITPLTAVDVYIDDVRLYATALSDKDVKALYNVKTRIDNKSNLYCNQLVETKQENLASDLSKITDFGAHGCNCNINYDTNNRILTFTLTSNSKNSYVGPYILNKYYGGQLITNKTYRYSIYVKFSKSGTWKVGEERIINSSSSPFKNGQEYEAGKWYKIENEGVATAAQVNFIFYYCSGLLEAGDKIEIRDFQMYRLYDNENYNPGPNIKGQYKTFELNETLTNNPNAKIVNKYNARWLQVFHHNTNNNTVWFKNAAEALHCNSTYKFSILDKLEYFRNKDGNFEFLLEYPIELPNKYNRWIQSDNPATTIEGDTPNGSPATGYTAIHVDWTDHLWGGLLKGYYTSKFCFIDGTTNHGNCYYAIGCYDNTNNTECIEEWRTHMPGPVSPVTEVNLYVRIDDNDNFKIYNRNTKANEIIEI